MTWSRTTKGAVAPLSPPELVADITNQCCPLSPGAAWEGFSAEHSIQSLQSIRLVIENIVLRVPLRGPGRETEAQ